MNVLAIDTTGKHLTVALKADGVWHTDFEVNCNLNHSVVLNQKIDGIMKSRGLSFDDLDAYAVNVGVGSFTGIRVGIATIKGFCLACPKKLVAVNTFEILAYNEGKSVSVFVPDNRGFYCQKFEDGKAQDAPVHLTEMPDCGKRIVFDNETDYSAKFAAVIDKKIADGDYTRDLQPLYIRKSQAEENL